MKIRVVDFETTGTPEQPRKAICEVGYTDIDYLTRAISEPSGTLIDPGHPIPPEMSAVHHIQDSDVAGAPKPTDACRMLMDGMGEGDLYAAHGARFERFFFGGAGRKWICTLKCASRLWIEAPKHTNQVLRYWLGLNLDGRAMPPHRARPDSFVTAHILACMLESRSLETLLEWSEAPQIFAKCSFGKYRGTLWRDLPDDYLDWVINESEKLGPDIISTARFWRERRQDA